MVKSYRINKDLLEAGLGFVTESDTEDAKRSNGHTQNGHVVSVDDPTVIRPALAMPERPIAVYVAGPLHSSGNALENIRRAVNMGRILRDAGFSPFIPHLFAFWSLMDGESASMTEAQWLMFDLEWLRKCDVLLRLPGTSKGADREEQEARQLGMPVFTLYASLVEWRYDRALKAEATRHG